MTRAIKNRKSLIVLWSVILILMLMYLSGCKVREKIYTIGIISKAPTNSEVFAGFKDGMVEQGYIENKNIKYIFNPILENNSENIDSEIKKLLALKSDLLLTTGNKAAIEAKKLVEGTDMPVIFSSNPWPVENGLVESLKHPGGNLTGIRIPDTTPKALEWLKAIRPKLKAVFVPYNPEDAVSVDHLPRLKSAATQLAVELITQKIHSVEDSIAAIEKLPDDVDAVFMISSPTLNVRGIELSRAANKRKMLTGAIVYDDEVLISLSPDFYNTGKKTAHIVHQIFQGNAPGNLPVETSEVILSINLKTAEKIGIVVPEIVLAQANKIIR